MSHWEDVFKKVLIIVMKHWNGMFGANKEVNLNVNESLTDGQAHGWDYCLIKEIIIGEQKY